LKTADSLLSQQVKTIPSGHNNAITKSGLRELPEECP